VIYFALAQDLLGILSSSGGLSELFRLLSVDGRKQNDFELPLSLLPLTFNPFRMARLSAASRLPPAIVRRIVQYTCHLIWSAGGASVSTMLPDYNRLRSVCWGWMEYVNEVHIHLDMLDLLTRRLNFDGSSIDMNKTLQGLMKIRKGSHFRRGKSYCPRQILAISLDSIEGKSWKERKEKGVKSGFESLFVQFNLVKKLHLEIECGGDIELASKFPCTSNRPFEINCKIPSRITRYLLISQH